MITEINDGLYFMDQKTYKKVNEWKNELTNIQIEKLHKKTTRIENKIENTQIALIGIIICITLIFLGVAIAQTSMIRELYDEYKPIKKECEYNCNNELIIDTDTLTL